MKWNLSAEGNNFLFWNNEIYHRLSHSNLYPKYKSGLHKVGKKRAFNLNFKPNKYLRQKFVKDDLFIWLERVMNVRTRWSIWLRIVLNFHFAIMIFSSQLVT
jgi:hypothetical protein